MQSQTPISFAFATDPAQRGRCICLLRAVRGCTLRPEGLTYASGQTRIPMGQMIGLIARWKGGSASGGYGERVKGPYIA